MPVKLFNKNIVKMYRGETEITKIYKGLGTIMYLKNIPKFLVFTRSNTPRGLRKFDILNNIHHSAVDGGANQFLKIVKAGDFIYATVLGERNLRRYSKDLVLLNTVADVAERRALATDGVHIYSAVVPNAQGNNIKITKFNLDLTVVATSNVSVTSGLINTLTLDGDNIYLNKGTRLRVYAKSNLAYIREVTLIDVPHDFYTHEGLANVYIAYVANNRGVKSYSKSANLEATTNSMPARACRGVVSDGDWVYFLDAPISGYAYVRKATMGLTSIYDSFGTSPGLEQYSIVQDDDYLYIGTKGTLTTSFKLATASKNTMTTGLFAATTAGDDTINNVDSLLMFDDYTPPPPPPPSKEWIYLFDTDSFNHNGSVQVADGSVGDIPSAKAALEAAYPAANYAVGTLGDVGEGGETYETCDWFYAFQVQEV